MRLTVIIIFFLAASPRLGSAAELAVYLDGALQPQVSEALTREPDFREGLLAGWRLFGALLPRDARENVGVIEVLGSKDAKLRVEDPEQAYPGLEPVVVQDPGGGLRFRMMVAGPGSRSRNGQAQKVRPARLGVEDVVEIHVAHGRPQGAAATTAPKAFDLVVGGKTDRISLVVLQGLAAAEHPPGAQGDAWSLRTLLEKKNAGDARAVVVRGRGDATTRIAAADLGKTYLRLNRRGFFKLEQLDPDGNRLANVPDVKRIDVERE